MRRFVMLCAAIATFALPSLALAEDVKNASCKVLSCSRTSPSR